MTATRLPKAIAESAAQAEAVEQQLRGGEPDPNPAPEPANVEPSPEPAPAPTADPAPDELMMQRHRSLQGTYNATVKKLEATARENDALRQELQKLQSAPTVDAEALQSSLAVMREQLGEELAGAVRQQVQAAVAEALQQYVEPLKNVVSSSVERDRERLKEAFYDRLDALAPNWEALNNDQGFLAWLKQYDPASGAQLSALLKDAETRLDADRAALFFRTYERDVLAANRQPEASPRPRMDAAPVQTRAPVKIWKRAEIEKFYQDQQRGVYRGREAEAQAIELDIVNAHREGRIS